jgi:hypothetical protein
LEVDDMQERDGRLPFVGSFYLCVLVSQNYIGRGKEPDRQVDPLERKCLSFPSLSVYLKKKDQKKLEEEGTCILSEEALELNVADVLACGSGHEFFIYENFV